MKGQVSPQFKRETKAEFKRLLRESVTEKLADNPADMADVLRKIANSRRGIQPKTKTMLLQAASHIEQGKFSFATTNLNRVLRGGDLRPGEKDHGAVNSINFQLQTR